MFNKKYCCVMMFVFLNGCTAIGPDSIKSSRTDYNMAIQSTNDQELLLNIVRARYRDNLYFTTVERIAASQELLRSSSVGFTAGVVNNTPLVNSNLATSIISKARSSVLSVGPASVALNEKPTIFYAPIDGEKFVRQMMTPLKPDILILLIKSGWSIDRVLMLGVQSMNDLENAPTASGPTPSYAPEFVSFREAAHLLREMQRQHMLNIVVNTNDKSIGVEFSKASENTKTAIKIKSLLGLNSDLKYFKLGNEAQRQDGQTVVVVTRPIAATINYLSQGVEVSKNDIGAGTVRQTVKDDGKTPFDWQDLLSGVFKVKESQAAPEHASVSVYYRGKWFYISDNDLDSKSSFMLLTQLMALHSTPPQSGTALTYSVGG